MPAHLPLSSRLRLLAPAAVVGSTLRPWIAGADEEPRYKATNDNALASMLSLLPRSFPGSDDEGLYVAFADIAAQIAAVGASAPDLLDQSEKSRFYISAISALAIAEPFRSYARVFDENRSLVGYTLQDIDQTLECGLPPDLTTLLRGRFDREALETAWSDAGYESIAVDGVEVASLYADATLDISSDLGRIALSRLNNAALLPDGTLVYTATLERMRNLIATRQYASFSSRSDMATIVASLEGPIASALIVDGSVLTVTAMLPPDLATDAAALERTLAEVSVVPMPPISSALFGITPGHQDNATSGTSGVTRAEVIIILTMAGAGTAHRAAETVEIRLGSLHSTSNGRPYSEMFTSWRVEPATGGDLLSITLQPAPGTVPSVWAQLLYQRDLLFLAW